MERLRNFSAEEEACRHGFERTCFEGSEIEEFSKGKVRFSLLFFFLVSVLSALSLFCLP